MIRSSNTSRVVHLIMPSLQAELLACLNIIAVISGAATI
jgi:hypothetical protein